MATIVDALLVTLGLDASNFKKGAQEADKAKDDLVKKTKKGDKQISDSEKTVDKERQRQQKENQARNKQFVDGLTKLRNETLGLFMIFTAGKGIASFISSSVNLAAALSRMHENVAMSTGDLAGWTLAAKNAGGSAEGMLNAIDKANAAVGSMRTGMANGDAIGYFKAGGTDKDAFKDTTSFLLAQADVVKRMYDADPTTALFKARQFLGIDTDTFNLMKLGRAEVLKKVADGKAVMGVTEGQGKQAINAQQQWNNLQETLQKVGREIVFALSPAVVKMLTNLTNFFGNKENIDGLTKSFETLGKNLENIDWKKAADGFENLIVVGRTFVSIIAEVIKGWTQLAELMGSKGNQDTVLALNTLYGTKPATKEDHEYNGSFRDSVVGQYIFGKKTGDAGGARIEANITNHMVIPAGAKASEYGDAASNGTKKGMNSALTAQAIGGTR